MLHSSFRVWKCAAVATFAVLPRTCGVTVSESTSNWQELGDVSLLERVVHVVQSSGGAGLRGAVQTQQMLERKMETLRRKAQCLRIATQQKPRMSMLDHASALAAQQHEMGAVITPATARGTSSATAPKYPFEPLLDVDYILDADNYLQDTVHGFDIPQQLAAKYVEFTASSTTSSTKATAVAAAADITNTTVNESTAANTSTENTAVLSAQAGAAQPTTAAATVRPASLLRGCFTRADPRTEGAIAFLARTAPHGSPCLFGITPADEGRHCVQDGGRYGSFGWCYTRVDRSEWGSCAEGCPTRGSDQLISSRIDRITQKVEAALSTVGVACG